MVKGKVKGSLFITLILKFYAKIRDKYLHKFTASSALLLVNQLYAHFGMTLLSQLLSKGGTVINERQLVETPLCKMSI